MEWIYADSSDQQHHFLEVDFPLLIRDEKITRETLVWNESMTDWQPCGQVRPTLFVDPNSPPPIPAASQQAMTPTAVTPGGYGATPIAPATGASIAALVCGILGLSCITPLSIAAVICGHIGMRQHKRNPDNSRTMGFSLTGIILGYIMIGVAILSSVVFWAAPSEYSPSSSQGTNGEPYREQEIESVPVESSEEP